MDKRRRLLERLEAIGASLAQSGDALAFVAVGSSSATDRLDAYSDLDFFVVVRDGLKPRYVADLGWLEQVRPLAYSFQNTRDGFKALFDDGVFCEFAVFEAWELPGIPFAPGRIVWKAPEFDPALAQPNPIWTQRARQPVEWLLGEALTNLYVGLGRLHRGECLSATRFIQSLAVSRVIELAALVETPRHDDADPFDADRRFEQRFPGVAAHLPEFVPGYERNIEAARAILAWLDAHFAVPQAMKNAIEALLQQDAP